MARPTIADLAQAAGVSVSTVDRVLNGRDPVRRPTAERVLAAAEEADSVALVAADHPRVTGAIDRLHVRGVPVLALVSDLSAPNRAGYVGLDNWKVGRTAAWAIANLRRRPGNVAIFVGS